MSENLLSRLEQSLRQSRAARMHLAARLRELEAEGVVTRRVVPETPVRVEYELTRNGSTMAEVVERLERSNGAYQLTETWRGRGSPSTRRQYQENSAPPARVSSFVPPPKPTVTLPTYSVVVNEVPVKELLNALAQLPFLKGLGRYRPTLSLSDPSIRKLARLSVFVIGYVALTSMQGSGSAALPTLGLFAYYTFDETAQRLVRRSHSERRFARRSPDRAARVPAAATVRPPARRRTRRQTEALWRSPTNGCRAGGPPPPRRTGGTAG